MSLLDHIAACSIRHVLAFTLAAPLVYALWRILHNLFITSLRSYPGPLLWRATSLPYLYYSYRGKLPQALLRVHRKHGKIVRVKPNQISYADSRAWKDVYAARPEFPKDAVLRPPNGAHNILTAPRDTHSRFRRLLSHAFSDKGLREQVPRIQRNIDLLMERLHEESGKAGAIDIVDWYTMIVFDITGELAWGESFQGLEQRRVHEWIPAIIGNVKFVAQFSIINELGLGRLALYLADPALMANRKKNYMLAAQLASKRAESKGELRGDFWDRVLIKSEGDDAETEGMTKAEMVNNASVLVLAGAETSATTLSGATYCLLKHPDVMKKLVEEIRTTFRSDDEIDVNAASRLTYLAAVLEETMRLYPAVTGPAIRVSPPEGGVVCGKFVAATTRIHVCPIAMNRLDGNFARPDDFVPERWLDDAPAEFANDDRQAFQPFVIGSRNCIGRNLAYAEMRLILAKLLYNFDLELDAGNKGDWLDQESYGVRIKGPLYVRLTRAQRE